MRVKMEAGCKMTEISIAGCSIKKINFYARTTCPNSSGVKPDLGFDQDQQCKIKHKTN